MYSKDPVIENRYKPDSTVSLSDSKLLSGGILAQLVFSKDSGESLRFRSRRIVRLQKVLVPQLLVSAWNSQYKVDAGECVLVSEERDERVLSN